MKRIVSVGIALVLLSGTVSAAPLCRDVPRALAELTAPRHSVSWGRWLGLVLVVLPLGDFVIRAAFEVPDLIEGYHRIDEVPSYTAQELIAITSQRMPEARRARELELAREDQAELQAQLAHVPDRDRADRARLERLLAETNAVLESLE